MSAPQAEGWTRRRFLGGLTLAGTAGLLGLHPRSVAAEPPPETTTLRLARVPAICVAPEYVAEALLQGEGFTEMQYVKKESSLAKQMALAATVLRFTPCLFGLDTMVVPLYWQLPHPLNILTAVFWKGNSTVACSDLILCVRRALWEQWCVHTQAHAQEFSQRSPS
jgi:hypothetical protein